MTAMGLRPRGGKPVSRRSLLLSAGAASLMPAAMPAADRGEARAADWTRYYDPSTEFEVTRFTHYSYASYLAKPPGRGVSRRGDFIIVSSGRSGAQQLCRIDLKHGENRILSAAANLQPGAFTLSADDRVVWFFDGTALSSVALSGSQRGGELWRGTGAAPLSISASEDGTSLWFAAADGTGAQLIRVRTSARPEASVATRQAEMILEPVPNPRRALVLWRTAMGGAWICEHDGANPRRIETPAGRVLQVLWSPDGQSVLYLHESTEAGHAAAIREQDVDSRADRLVARTSLFACFARNSDGSVYVGSSSSQASPLVLLLLRVNRRELALGENKSRDAAKAAVALSADSQRLFFQGDREGNPTVYSIKLEKLVEKTGS